MRAEASHTPDQVVQFLDRALQLLRYYEADGLPPHDVYSTYRQNRADQSNSWVEGSPNPAKLVGVRDRAAKYAASWSVISSQSDAMRELRQELSTESNIYYTDWFGQRLGLRQLPAWTFVIALLVLPLLPLVMAVWIVWHLTERTRMKRWTQRRMERWNDWVRRQGGRP